MQQADDLMSAATEAQAATVPLVLMVSATDCTYCAQLRAEVIEPTLLGQSERRTAVFRELLVDVLDDIRDFDGNMTSASEIAERYGADLTPTLLFLAPNGAEAAARIVGISNIDFYAWYMDAQIEKATARLRGVTTG